MSKIIEIIQGDTKQYLVSFDKIEDRSIIKEIVFCSVRLGVRKEIKWDSHLKSYILEFTPKETKEYPACRADYTITVKFVDSNINTPCLKGELFVREKPCNE